MIRALLLGTVLAAGLVSAASAAMVNFSANLTGPQEVPPTTSKGYGTVLATLDTSTKKLSYTLTYGDLTGPAVAAHFHGPAAPGANAGVAVPIGAPPANPTHGEVTLTDAQINDLMAGKWYANVHTAANKGGEIRGQVLKVK